MTNIRRVVRSVLRDVIQAQHDANLFSQQLSEEYAASGAGAIFSLPAAQVGELEIEIKYAIASQNPEDSVRTEVNAREEKRLVVALSRELSKLIVTKMMVEVQQSGLPYVEKGFGYIDELANHTELIDYIAARMQEALTENSSSMYLDGGKFDIDYIADKVLEVGEKCVVNHSEITALFDLEGGENLRQNIMTALDTKVTESIRQITDSVSQEQLFRKRVTRHSMPVIVDSEALAALPAETIQTMRIKIAPQQLKQKE